MKKQLKIGSIYLDFTYSYSDYFKDALNQYETLYDNKDKYFLEVLVVDSLIEKTKLNSFVYKNRIKYSDDLETTIVTRFPNGNLKHIITYSNDFRFIRIELSCDLGKRLAEYEYVLSGMMFFEIALRNKYLPIHASAIKVKNQAILFSGPSKSGKSTQTKYFLSVDNDLEIINEDKPLIKIINNEAFVFGSPWSGKDVLNKNIKVRLRGIFFLNKKIFTSIIKVDDVDRIKVLMKNVHRPGDEVNINNMVEVLNNIIDTTNLYVYNCENNINSSLALKKFLEENI